MSFALHMLQALFACRPGYLLLGLAVWYALPAAAQSSTSIQVRQLPNTALQVVPLSGQSCSFGSAAFVTLQKQAAELEIALADGSPIRTAVILPKIFDLPFSLQQGKLYLKLNSAPAHWQVVINGDSLNPLWLLANWPDAGTALHRQKQTLVVGQGLHDWSKPDSLPDLAQIRRIHLRPGAVVRAQLVWQTDEPVSITGSGIWLAATPEPAITLKGQKGIATLEQCVVINPAGPALAVHKPLNAFGIRVFGGSGSQPAVWATAESQWDKCLLDAAGNVIDLQGPFVRMTQTHIGRWRQGSVFTLRSGADSVGQIQINQTTIMASETANKLVHDTTAALVHLADGGQAQRWGSLQWQHLACDGPVTRLLAVSLQQPGGLSRLEKLEMEDVQMGAIALPSLLWASPGNRMTLRLRNVRSQGKLVVHNQFLRKGSVSLGIQ